MSGVPVDFTPFFPPSDARHRTVEFEMSEENILKSVLVVAEDLGFALWAGRIFADAGYQTWPAKTVSDALKWVEEPGANFRLLLIDLGLPGTRYLVQTARRKYPGLKVALLREAGDPADIGADAVISKPSNVDSPDIVSAWLEEIVRITSEH
jgi:CheY-like chemotaxis protein